MSLELMASVFIPWGEFCIDMLASCWCHWVVPNWHLFYCLAAEQILQTNNVEVISYYPSQTYWMYLFWAFVEALGLIGYLHSDGGASWWRKRYEPIGWRDAVFLARLYYYSPFYGRPLWNGLNLLVIYMGKYRGQWLWAKWQSTIAGTDLLAWNGAKSPNWSTTILMLALHEVETPPTPPKPINMVSGVMLVKGYSMRQQSAIMVSEYLPSLKMMRKSKLTLEEQPQPCLYSLLYRRPLWNTLNLLVMYMGKYIWQ
jgi:hypothetical protein